MESAFAEEDGRERQLEAIFRTQFAGLYRYIYRQVHHPLVAEDLTSAVFLKALRWLQEERSAHSVKGWLYAAARSAIADYWHEQGQLTLLPLEGAEEIPEFTEVHDTQRSLLHERIQRLLDGLSERERTILTLRYFQEYSAAEIGQELGLSANHVRVLQLRALRRAALLEAEERNSVVETPDLPYTRSAQRVLALSKEAATAFHHRSIGTEHVLLGIFEEGSAAAGLIAQGLTAQNIRGGIVFILGGRSQGEPGSDVDVTHYSSTFHPGHFPGHFHYSGISRRGGGGKPTRKPKKEAATAGETEARLRLAPTRRSSGPQSEPGADCRCDYESCDARARQLRAGAGSPDARSSGRIGPQSETRSGSPARQTTAGFRAGVGASRAQDR